jgi:hypothetical protein
MLCNQAICMVKFVALMTLIEENTGLKLITTALLLKLEKEQINPKWAEKGKW